MSFENPFNKKEDSFVDKAKKFVKASVVAGAVSIGAMLPHESDAQTQSQDKKINNTEQVTDYEKGNPFDSADYESDEDNYRALKRIDNFDPFVNEGDDPYEKIKKEIFAEFNKGSKVHEEDYKKVKIVRNKTVSNPDGTVSLWIICELNKNLR